MGKDHRKLTFYVEQDEDGWPADQIETLWAREAGEGLYVIDNIPFFVRGVSWGDIVSVEQSSNELLFKEVVRSAGHCTIRIIFLDSSAKDETSLR
ncbi:MAG: DUF4265 domain-containing protein [Planctomycetes bacterium]|nr:DUF4265 domain-containing protein [Planctomycetota bacterium]